MQHGDLNIIFSWQPWLNSSHTIKTQYEDRYEG